MDNCFSKCVQLSSDGESAVLLLDEIDLASNKIMCLQPILDATACLLKRLTSSFLLNSKFQVFATANTKV